MSTKLKAGTSTSGAVIDADTSGNLDLVSGSSSQYTASLPLASGTVMVSGNMPAFSANNSTLQSISSSTFTKVNFPTASVNIGSYYNTSTSTFSPAIAGYYLVQANIGVSGSGALTRVIMRFVTNGGSYVVFDTPSTVYDVGGSQILYFNGTTDYVYVDTYLVAASPSIDAGATYTRFSACMIRGV